MSLSSALSIINSAFVANAAQSAVISSNISNAGHERLCARDRQPHHHLLRRGGGRLGDREANAALLEQVNTSTSQAAYQQALSNGLSTLAQTVSDSSSATSTSGADAERQFAVGDARQPAERARDL